jgi:CRP-like cAMP-binding protein
MDVSFFRSHPLTKGLTGPEIDRLRGLLEEARYRAGESLFHEGAAANGLVLVTEGAVRVSKKDPAGTDRDLVVLEAPTVLGELELISTGPCHASATATAPVRALVLTAEAFERLVNEGDAVASKIIRNIARVVIRRLGESNARMVALFAQGSP